MNQKYYINEKKQITLLVLKSDKFKEVKEEQLENIQLISLTLLVLKLNKFKEEHENLLSNLQFFFSYIIFLSSLSHSQSPFPYQHLVIFL
jgi:hypothetical protein